MTRHAWLAWLLAGLSLFITTQASAKEYYVATTGNDSNPGTLEQPFASLQKGHDVAAAGDTVWIRGGTYKIVNGASDMSGVSLSKSGQSDTLRIKFWAYAGEVPIFDFSGLKLSATKTSAGIYVTGSWLHLKGLEIANVPEPGTVANNGIWNVNASNNIFELLNLHHNSGPGLSIANSKGTGGHLVLNCDSHDNYDAKSAQGAGQNADGFGHHYQSTGPSTIYRGCRAWWNSDDGYDLISQEVPVIIEGCWAMGNGYIDSGKGRPASGNGNGFKAGSSKTGVRHTLRNNLAWGNTAAGFYANHSSGGNDWFNNTSYDNGTQYNLLASPAGDSATTITLSGALAHKMRNNIGFPNENTNMGGVDTASNSWDLNLTPAAGDFVSVSDTGFMGPRKPDGSLPALDFMRLHAGSQFIDKGTDVKLPSVGAAPDLGAFEFGATTTSTGGTGTSGGTGSGGAFDPIGGTASVGGSVAVGGATTGGSNAGGSASGTSIAGGSVGVGGFAPAAGGSESGAGPNEDDGTAAGCTCRAVGAGGGAWSGALFATAVAVSFAVVRRRRAA